MRIVPQQPGLVSRPPQVLPSETAEQPPVRFSAQSAPLSPVPAETLRAQRVVKFGNDDDKLSFELRQQLAGHLMEAAEGRNAKLKGFLEAGVRSALNHGEREVTVSHVALGLLETVGVILTNYPQAVSKADSRRSPAERDMMDLVYAVFPSAKSSGLDAQALKSVVTEGIQTLRRQMGANKEPLQADDFAFDQELIGLVQVMLADDNADRLATMDRSRLIQFLATEAPGLNVSPKTKAALGVLGNMDKAAAKFDPFSEIGGYDGVKQELKIWLHLLKNPGDATDFGIKLEKGAIFMGPPGTGKTLFARCIAKSIDGGFHATVGSDFAKMYLGETAKGIRTFFSEARKQAEKTGKPQVVFIDEIEAIARKRGSGGSDGASKEMENALNTLLSEIDGFQQDNSKLIIMGATNRPEVLDPAITRAGRLGTKFQIDLPDETARSAIFKVHSKNKPLDKELNLQRWSELSEGMSGADIEALMSEAARVAFQDYIQGGRTEKKVTENDLLEAFKNKSVGRKNNASTDPRDLEMTVHHETFGHNAIAYALGYDIKIVTSVGRGQAAGFVLPSKSTFEQNSIRGALADLVMGLAGQAAEEALAGPSGVSYGAHSDYNQARQRITQMITSGMIPGHGTENYSGGYAGMNTSLSAEDRKLSAFLLKTSREAALKMIEAIPPEAKQGMIEEAMGGIDYSFEEAMDFNRRHLGKLDGEVVQALRKIFDEHVDRVIKAVQQHAEAGADEYAPKKDAPKKGAPPLTFSGDSNNVLPLPKRRLNMMS